MTFIAVRLSTADVATINHGCPLLVPDRKPTLPSRRSGRGDGGEDGGDLSASWRATRRLPWKRGDQIQLGHRQFQILTSTTLHTYVGMSVLTASLTSSRPIPENREPGDAKDARRGWDRVLGRRGGRRCPSLLTALGPSLPAQFTVCVGAVRLHVGPTARPTTCSPQSPLPAGPSRGDVQRSPLSGHPALPKTFEMVIANVFLPCERRACLPGPAVYDAERPQTRSRDTTRTRCLPDSDILSLSVHRHDHQTLGSTQLLARPRQPCRAPGTRTRSLLSRWLRMRAVAILCSAASNSLVRLCRSSPTVPSRNLFTRAAALAAAGPCSPRLTLDGRMGTIPAGLNFQQPEALSESCWRPARNEDEGPVNSHPPTTLTLTAACLQAIHPPYDPDASGRRRPSRVLAVQAMAVACSLVSRRAEVQQTLPSATIRLDEGWKCNLVFRLWKAIVSRIACLFASTPSGSTRSPHLPPRPCHRQSFNRYRKFDGRLPLRTHCSRACSVLTSSRPWSRLAKPFSVGEPRILCREPW